MRGQRMCQDNDLRMCAFVDRVLQMQDGKLVREYTGADEIRALIDGGARHGAEPPASRNGRHEPAPAARLAGQAVR